MESHRAGKGLLPMLLKVLIACVLVTVTVGMHAVGFAMLLRALDEIARPDHVGFLAHHLAGDRLDVLADRDPPGRDYGLGAVLFLAGMPA